MSKYRFKNKKEFIRDGLWDEEFNFPDGWASDQQMNNYLGKDIPDEFNVQCDDNEKVKYDGWLFQNTDYVLKEQQEYFDDLSQHIGRRIRALVDNPHLGIRVKKGDVGKIINKDQVAFPNNKKYYCSTALNKNCLGIKYELLSEDYSPEQEPNVEFIPGKWYKLIDCENSYRKCSQIPVENRLPYSELIGNGSYRCETGSSGDLTRIKLVEDLSEIQEYLPDGHPDKIGSFNFEVGKWYKWYQKNHGNYHYGKVKEINITTDTLVMTPWIMQCDNYNYSGTFDLSKAEQIKEISVEDIQEFLPKNHSDKITSNGFKTGEYIVITDKFDDFGESFISNHIYKQRYNSNFLQPEYDSLNSTTNGWKRYTRNNTHNWRYATQEEIDEYERRGKPYDVTELHKKELSMEQIQEECKKRFPIGCTFASTNGEANVLKDDSSTYAIVGQNIWAHSGGPLYEAGKWAPLVSLPEENITEIPEYIECTETQESYFIKGNVYKVIDSKNLASVRLVSNIELSQISAGTSLFCSMEIDGKKYWKPSTKEAYEQQKIWLETSEKLTTKLIMGTDPYEGAIDVFTHDEIKQFPSISSDYWKNVPTFVEKEFDIYGPTPDIE